MNANESMCFLVGAGRAGRALAQALSEAGFQFGWIVSRDIRDAEGLAAAVGGAQAADSFTGLSTAQGVLILAVPDTAIQSTAEKIADAGLIAEGNTIALHLSGTLGSDSLASLKNEGAAVMAFHPGQTFTKESDWSKIFTGICFDMEGDKRAIEAGRNIAGLLKADAAVLSAEQRVFVHTAMSMASNYSAVLLSTAESLLKKAGIEREIASKMLAPLATSTVTNCFEQGPEHALTGPVARGDTASVATHLALLERVSEEAAGMYRTLGKAAARIAHARGSISSDTMNDLLRLLQ